MATGGATQFLHVSEETLAAYRGSRNLLGVQFSDGNWYYPGRQFVTKPYPHVVEGLKEVLDAFVAAGTEEPDVWATWLAGLLEADVTMWDALRAGRVEEVALQAGRDSRWWRS